MAAVAATNNASPRLPRPARAAVLTVHIVMSVGWVGLLGALVALDVICLATNNPIQRVGIETAMTAVVAWVLIPVVCASLISGLVLALSTPWGLVRHWWVLAKCAIAIVLTATGAVLMLPVSDQIAAGNGGEMAGMQTTLVARSVALLLLLAATGFSVVKPWGKTPHGRRVQLASGRSRLRPAHPVQQK